LLVNTQQQRAQAIRAAALRGETPRYIIRCGLVTNGKVIVWDALGGWPCSYHKSLALAQRRADKLNESIARESTGNVEPELAVAR
jgi:hypothetical protein